MHPPYRLLDIRPTASPELLSLSPVLAETVARSVVASNQPALVLRSQAAYILLGPHDRRLPKLAEGVRWVQAQGLPVLFRLGGGSAVLLDRHCVSFAVIQTSRDLTAWRSNFEHMTEGVLRGLNILGISAEFGEAAGSYCPGPYDLLVGGRKVAGVAQAIRRGYAMVSGMLVVDQDPTATTAFLQEFYQRCGDPRILRPEAVARLDSLTSLTRDAVFDAVIAGYAQMFPLEPSALTASETALAIGLYRDRCLV